MADAVGTWKQYLSYSTIESVAPAGNIIYVKANGNLFSYNKTDHSVVTYTRQTGLTSTDITPIAWVSAAKKLLIVYKDYTIDLLSANGDVEALFGLKNYVTTASKSISSVTVSGQYAYLVTGLGVLMVNAKEGVIQETFPFDRDLPVDTQEHMTEAEYLQLSGSARPDGPAHPEHYYL